LPTAVLAASIQIIAFISLTAGIILDSVCHGRRQAKRLVYLSMPPVNAGRGAVGVVSGVPNGEPSELHLAPGSADLMLPGAAPVTARSQPRRPG
jgi:hypothetical protein